MRVEHLSDDVRLILGDCREILPTLGRVDAVITDPPYGVSLRNHGNGKNGWTARSDFTIANDDAQTVAQEVIDWAQSAGLTVVAFASPRLPWSGKWRSRLVWDKGGAVGGGGDPRYCWKQTWELIQVYNVAPLNGSRDASVLQFWTNQSSMADHPTQKPVALMEYLIGKVSANGQTILDPFMGSGSTGVAAVKMGRGFVGCEIDERYFDIACRRVSDALKQPDMFIARPAPAKQEAMAL